MDDEFRQLDLDNWRNIANPYRYKMLVDVANYVARELLACEVAMLHAKVLNYARALFSSVDVFCSYEEAISSKTTMLLTLAP